MKKNGKRTYLKLSESDIELTITNAFLGASKNLYLLMRHFSKKVYISLNQYYNYLSLLVLCLELGLKNIIKNTHKIWTEHDLEVLFYEADKEANNCISKNFFGSHSEKFQNDFTLLLKKAKDLYVEARYCSGKTLDYFISYECITKDNLVDFNKLIEINDNLAMLILFFEELGEFHNFLHKNSIKEIYSKDDLDSQIQNSCKNKFLIQESVVAVEKKLEMKMRLTKLQKKPLSHNNNN